MAALTCGAARPEPVTGAYARTVPRSDLLIVMPAWNEREALPDTLDEVALHVPQADVLVVDDGSTDGTGEVARAHGALVLTLPYNLGVGGAMRAGFRYGVANGYSTVVQVDADGQHDPAEMGLLLDALGDADVVIGARFAERGDYVVRGPRRWAMKVLGVAVGAVAGTRLTDTTSGFRAANARAVEFFSRNYPAEYLGDTVESLVLAARAGLVVRQVPVRMRPRRAGTPSQADWKAALYLSRACVALGLALLRKAPARVPARQVA